MFLCVASDIDQSVDKTDLGPYIRYFEEKILPPLLLEDKKARLKSAAARSTEKDVEENFDHWIYGYDAIVREEKGISCTSLDW